MNGQWWIKDREDLPDGNFEPPEHRVTGTLNDDGAGNWSLDTIGGITGQSLHGRWDSRNQMQSGPVTIWGVNTDHRAFSLMDCYAVRSTIHFGSPFEGTERWQVGTIVEGNGVWVDSDIIVDKIMIEYEDLAAWAWDRNEPGAEPDYSPDNDTLTVSSIGKIEEASACEYPVHLNWGRSWFAPDGPIKMWPSACFTIEHSLKIGEIAEKWVIPLGQLLSLLTQSSCGVISVRAQIPKWRDEAHPKEVVLRFEQGPVSSGGDEGEQPSIGRQRDMLATRIALEERGVDLTALLSAYLELEENPKLSDALGHFVDSQARAESGEVDEALRYLFNSFENFHAARFESTVEDSEDLGAEIKRLVKETAIEHRSDVSDRLYRKRQKSMRQKLQDLVDACGETAADLLAIRPELVADAGDARNEIAHANPRSASRWKRYEVLFGLQWLIRHAFLQQLGVKSSDCDDLFREIDHPFTRYTWHR